jgi:cellulose biosynthesis protein BcsQ
VIKSVGEQHAKRENRWLCCFELTTRGDAMKKITVFNHKGGVGKTTLVVNLADALADQGKRVLIVDADPQCNLSAFFLSEDQLDKFLGQSETEEVDEFNTLWAGLRPVVLGRGDVVPVELYEVRKDVLLLVGDVLISQFEEELPAAWTDSFARKVRGYDVMCSLSRLLNILGQKHAVDYILIDVGPNVGPLNRAILLDSDFFTTPVAADLFSLRALGAVGHTLGRWIQDWQTVRSLAPTSERERLMRGMPAYLGYINSAFKVRSGDQKTKPHEYWEKQMGPRIAEKLAGVLESIDPELVCEAPYILGEIKHFQSLPSEAQQHGLALSKLRGKVNPGHNAQIALANETFTALAREIVRRIDNHEL